MKLAHVALAAGVSLTTASEALRGKERVSDETRRRVLDEAKRLGYVPDAKARSLRMNSRRMVGLVSDVTPLIGTQDSPRWFYPQFLTSLMHELNEHGCSVVLFAEPDPEALAEAHLDGLIFASELPEHHLPASLTTTCPVCFISLSPGQRMSPLGTEQLQGIGNDALDHLKLAGAQHPALIRRRTGSSVFDQFIEGYRTWCEKDGIEPLLIQPETDDDYVDLVRQLRSAQENGVDALYSVFGDAAIMLDLCRQASLRVPEDIMLLTISTGGIERHLVPTITSLEFDGYGAGRLLAERALSLMEQIVIDEPMKLPHRLVVRESTSRK